jgi:uncharacterized membrane protein
LAPLLLAAAFFVGCQGSGDLPLDQVDPTAVTDQPTYQQVDAILQRSCVPCHAGGSDDESENESDFRTRITAGDVEPNLEDCGDVVAQRSSILEQVDANLMPPGAWPRLTSKEKLTIRRWIDNGAPAPCN